MQELRFVLIIVGALAIAALLFHGLWTSKKEGKAKFGNKPLGKLEGEEEGTDNVSERAFAPEDDFEIIRKPKRSNNEEEVADPLIDDYVEPVVEINDVPEDDHIPSISIDTNEPLLTEEESVLRADAHEEGESEAAVIDASGEKQDEEERLDVIVLNVHCSSDQAFVGTKLFESMQQNGLLYGEMDIFHRHADISGTGKVLFSVANMMQPGTLKHDDPATFTTKGISFFMTLPGFGDPEQNFKLMLKTAQQIADDLSANVLDDARNLMTPNRLDAYRAQIKEFKARSES
ncbi:cell division protein ZipA [Vibrio sonorensis]|uniref:cell division protein ZipA n=1 Tax=Vibrio sonorensis TaxID=1004316 RepID=UPI0008D9F4A8|nr:cell division protein ZipA [Vibrio sonorensis]